MYQHAGAQEQCVRLLQLNYLDTCIRFLYKMAYATFTITAPVHCKINCDPLQWVRYNTSVDFAVHVWYIRHFPSKIQQILGHLHNNNSPKEKQKEQISMTLYDLPTQKQNHFKFQWLWGHIMLKKKRKKITFPSVFADNGAMTIRSAHRQSSMWSTLSPIFFQVDHSSSSV